VTVTHAPNEIMSLPRVFTLVPFTLLARLLKNGEGATFMLEERERFAKAEPGLRFETTQGG